ncbi:MAG TPA: hypothetical protein VEA63_06865, partial [Opitutus sp.]|nr:hypothetical protein [Opitutus sp.]
MKNKVAKRSVGSQSEVTDDTAAINDAIRAARAEITLADRELTFAESSLEREERAAQDGDRWKCAPDRDTLAEADAADRGDVEFFGKRAYGDVWHIMKARGHVPNIETYRRQNPICRARARVRELQARRAEYQRRQDELCNTLASMCRSKERVRTRVTARTVHVVPQASTRHGRSRRPVRVAQKKTVGKAAADPDGPPRPRTSSSGGAW